MLNYILSLLGFRSRSAGRELGANVKVPAHASMAVVVRKFTGRYECGCVVDVEVLQPDECARHPGAKKVFQEIDMGVQHTERVMVPASVFEERA